MSDIILSGPGNNNGKPVRPGMSQQMLQFMQLLGSFRKPLEDRYCIKFEVFPLKVDGVFGGGVLRGVLPATDGNDMQCEVGVPMSSLLDPNIDEVALFESVSKTFASHLCQKIFEMNGVISESLFLLRRLYTLVEVPVLSLQETERLNAFLTAVKEL